MSVKILFVEDDEGIAEAIAESLRLVGIEVTVCGTYVAAVDAVRTLNFDTVLSDGIFPGAVAHGQPGPYGIGLLVEARKLGKAVLLLSGNDALVQEARALGIPALTKPVSREQILEALDRQTAEESFKTQSKRKGNGG